MRGALLLTLLCTSAFAAVPEKLTIQGRLLKADGTPETGVVAITFSLFDSADAGERLWTETQQVGLSDGFYATQLGATTAIPADVFSGPERFLAIEVGGEELKPRLRVASVPYAVTAKSVSGGVVDAAEVKVAGTTVIDGSGALVGPAAPYAIGSGLSLTGNTLSLLLGCAAGQVPQWSGATWACGAVNPGTVIRVEAGAGLAGGPITSTGTLSIAPGGVSNPMLQNDSVEIMAGPGVSVSPPFPVPLGGSATITNTGVLSVSATAPLASTGGQNPTLSLAGGIPIVNGGTGATTAAGALTNLGAAPATGSTSYIQNQTSAAQAANVRISGTVRLGSESGTDDPPDYPGNGLIVRRIRSVTTTSGSVVAISGTVTVERDGTSGGLSLSNSGVTNPNVKCFTMTSAGTVGGKAVTVSGGNTVTLLANADNVVMLQCQFQYSHSNSLLDEGAVLQLARTSFADSIWSGFITSTTNQ